MTIENQHFELPDPFVEQAKLEEKYARHLKPGRWIYCKYCYGKRTPVVHWDDGLIKCGTCDYGLVPLQDDHSIILWILGKWWDYIEIEFAIHNIEYELENPNHRKHTPEKLFKALSEGKTYLKEIDDAVAKWQKDK